MGYVDMTTYTPQCRCAGHALLAAAAAQFVINRMEAPRQPAHLVNARPLLRSKAPFEHCYEDAAHLPVVPMSMSNTSGWRLVDDGRDRAQGPSPSSALYSV